MSSTTGNTTVPGRGPRRPHRDPGPTHTVAVVLCWYPLQPSRVGQVAFCDPQGNSDLVVGRAGNRFFIQRPGVVLDCGKLRGDKVSREQLAIRPEGDGARIHNVGNAVLKVNGRQRSRSTTSAFVQLPAVIEIVGHSVMLLTAPPVRCRRRTRDLLPLHAFGSPTPGDRRRVRRRPLARGHRPAAERGDPVLIIGETGTGKELVARGIHAKSRFARGRPSSRPTARTLRGKLAALQLFGGPKGWPNPGTPETIGYFETAGIGVLFLDEIGEVDGNVQSILLRAIEHGFSRKGDPKVRPCAAWSSSPPTAARRA